MSFRSSQRQHDQHHQPEDEADRRDEELAAAEGDPHLARGLEDPGSRRRPAPRRCRGTARIFRIDQSIARLPLSSSAGAAASSAASAVLGAGAQPRGVEPAAHRRRGLGRQLPPASASTPVRSSWRSRSSMRDSTASGAMPGLRRQRPAGHLRREEGPRAGEDPVAGAGHDAGADRRVRGVGIAVAELRPSSRRRSAPPRSGPRAPRRPAGRRARRAAPRRAGRWPSRARISASVGVGLGGAERGRRPGSGSRRPASGRSRSARSAFAATSSMRAASAATLSCSVPISARRPSTSAL